MAKKTSIKGLDLSQSSDNEWKLPTTKTTIPNIWQTIFDKEKAKTHNRCIISVGECNCFKGYFSWLNENPLIPVLKALQITVGDKNRQQVYRKERISAVNNLLCPVEDFSFSLNEDDR